MHQAGMIAQQGLQASHIAAHDGVDSGLEGGHRGRTIAQRLDMRDELWPARESVFARDDELGLGEPTGRVGIVLRARLLPAAGDAVGLALAFVGRRLVVGPQRAGKRIEPAAGPEPDRRGITGGGRLPQILGESAVLSEVGTRRERLRVRYANLLS
jgi:hypothetical protein